MRIIAARWLRTALLVASVAALAAGLVDLVTISDERIVKLAQQFGPVARERLTGWKGVLTDPKNKRLPELKKLELVNDLLNQPRFLNDIEHVKELVIYKQAHMILAYLPAPDADPLVLDNINKTIQPASTRTDLLPVYSFNGSGLWLAKEGTGRGQQVGGSDRIALWRDLQARMRTAN